MSSVSTAGTRSGGRTSSWTFTLGRLSDPFGNPQLIGFVIAICGFLTLAYVGFYGFTALAATVRRDEH